MKQFKWFHNKFRIKTLSFFFFFLLDFCVYCVGRKRKRFVFIFFVVGGVFFWEEKGC